MPASFATRSCCAALSAFCLIALPGCEEPEPIVTYTIPTKMPEQLREGQDRMLAVMLPKADQVWFFKVVGPELAMANVVSPFQKFVSEISFNEAGPDLKELPYGWQRAGEKPMRYASINIDTPSKQLDLSVSKLARQEDWDKFVVANVNRWRRQLGLEPSEEKWAGGEEFEIEAADGPGVWVDLVGSGGEASMSPPFAGSGSMPPGHPEIGAATDSNSTTGQSAVKATPDERLSFDRPDGWRDGKMSSMRMAAFNVGPEDAPAEITVIPAGGDLKGNVKRWLGQVKQTEVSDQQLDEAMAEAIEVEVSGRKGHRYILVGDQETIDATIVPIDDTMSLFIKMKGPSCTVADQADAIGQFIESLELKL